MIRFSVSLLSPDQRPSGVVREQLERRKPSLIALLIVVLAFGCSNDIDSRLASVYELEESGDLEQSIVALREILEVEPKHPEANFLLGSALVQTGQQKEAIPPLEIATRSKTYAIPGGLLLSATQFRTRAYEDSLRTSQAVLEIDPDNLTALFTHGRSNLAAGRPEAALADANRILEVKPKAQNAIVMKAGALVKLDRRDEAESIWLDLKEETVATGSPNQAALVCVQLARFYQNHDENDRAEATYVECLEENPTHASLQAAASDFFIRRNQPERAIEIHQNAVDTSPDDIRAWNRLARVLYDHGEPGDALRKLEEMVERFDSPAAWRLLADFHRRTRNITEARKAIEEAILRSAKPPEAFFYSLAEFLVEEGRLQRAQGIIQNLTQPGYRRILAGAIQLRSGKPRQALEQLDVGLRLWPDNAHGHYLAGLAALALRDRRRAVVEFQEAIRIGDNSTDAAVRLAEIYFARGNYPLASRLARYQIANRPYLDPTPYSIAIHSALRKDRIEEATEIVNALREADPAATAVVVETSAIKRAQSGAKESSEYVLASGRDLSDPENEPILRSLSNDLNALGRADDALALIDKAVARDDGAAPLHDLRARVLSHLGRMEEAGVSANRALEIDPKFAPALEMKAYIALEAGDQTTALAALDAATEAALNNSQYPYSAASVAREMGDTAGAISRLEEALARQPLFGPAANDLAWILATDLLDLERALRLAQVAARQNRSTNTLTTLGWVRHQRGEYEDAIKIYRDALEVDANLPTVRYRLGLSLSEAGHANEAEGLFDALVEGPDFPEIEAARAELARIKGS